MLCNHHTCTTRFCPYCGKEINPPGPLHALRSHVAARVGALIEQRKDVEKQWAALGREPSSEEAVERDRAIGRIDRNYTKWLVWRDALDELLFPPDKASNS